MDKPMAKVVNDAPGHDIKVIYDEHDPDASSRITLEGKDVERLYGIKIFQFRIGGRIRRNLIEALLEHMEYEEGP